MKVRLDIEVDEEVARDLDRAAERLGCSKATFVEEAIRDKAMNAEPRPVRDPAEVERILKASFGVMKREETPADFEQALDEILQVGGIMKRDEPPEETARKAKELWEHDYAERRARRDGVA